MELLSLPCNNNTTTTSVVSSNKKEAATRTTKKNIPPKEVDRIKKLLFPPPSSPEKFFCEHPPETSDGHVKRPCNNFIIFRKLAHDQRVHIKELKKYNQRDFSHLVSKLWKLLSPEEKGQYTKFAKEVATMHRNKNPSYKYQPKRLKAAWKQVRFQNQEKSHIEMTSEFEPPIDNNNHLNDINLVNSVNLVNPVNSITVNSINPCVYIQPIFEPSPPQLDNNSIDYNLLNNQLYIEQCSWPPQPQWNNMNNISVPLIN